MSYGDVLERARKSRKLTNVTLAVRAGLSPATVNRLKKSSRNVTVESIDKAAAELGLVAIIKLVPKSEETPPNP